MLPRGQALVWEAQVPGHRARRGFSAAGGSGGSTYQYPSTQHAPFNPYEAVDAGFHLYPQSGPDASKVIVASGRDREDKIEVPVDKPDHKKLAGEFAALNASYMTSLSTKSADDLDAEIKTLEALHGQLHQHTRETYGDHAAVTFDKLGGQLAQGGIDGAKYRTSVSADVASHQVSGWDEMVQTAMSVEGAHARREALAGLSASPNHDRLARIHELTTQIESQARVPTAAVSQSYDGAGKSRLMHPTEASFQAGTSVGASPLGHKLRSGYMLHKEKEFLDKNPGGVTYTDVVRNRVMAAERGTISIMSDATTANTNGVFQANTGKVAVMAEAREAGKKVLREQEHSFDYGGAVRPKSPSPERP